MRTVALERRCPKCGHEMYLLPYSCNTLHGIKTCDAICKNCLHVEQVKTIVVREEK